MLNKKGFTLVELLVTISIIAILSAVGLIIFNNVQKTARDSKKVADIREIQKALEVYFIKSSQYPASLNDISNNTYFTQGVVPKDPQNKDYIYTGRCGSNDQKYVLCTTELESTNSLTNRCCPPGDSCSPVEDRSGPVKYYCVGNP